MKFLQNVITFLDSEMTMPTLYGWFHLLCFALAIGLGVFLCVKWKNPSEKQVRIIMFVISAVVIVLEIYKQINYTYSVTETGIAADFQWYAFPWQFCSMPMYVGLLASILPNGKVHRALCAFLATYAVFAGACVMFYPADVFIKTIGINIQTMVCHGTMISLGMFLLATGYVKTEHKTILRAIPVFSSAVIIAMTLNEIAHHTNFTNGEIFNMFFISPHEDPSLPIYSIVQQYVPYPLCLIIYIAAFSLAAYIILLIAMGIKAAGKKLKKA